jgi:glycosyltransferase involved in cell wall biosynthesis
MRLLLASDHFPPFIGGGHRWAAQLAAGLAGRGHEVSVATVWHGRMPRVERFDGSSVMVYRVRQLRTVIPLLVRDQAQRHQPPFPDPISIRELRSVLRRTSPQIVLAHGWMALSVAAALRGSDIPLVIAAHDYGYFCATRRLLFEGELCDGPRPRKCVQCAADYYGLAKGCSSVAGIAFSRRPLVQRIDGLQSVSSLVDDAMTRHLLGRDADRARVRRFVISSWVDDDAEASEASRVHAQELLARLPTEPFIMYVGAFRADKGLSVLFDAYARLAQPPPLVLMGTFERDTPPLPATATVLTDAPHTAVMAAWKRALFGVMPSLLPEPLGMVAVEAMTQGAPMIASRPGGIVDLIGSDAGLLVPQGDADALAAAMSALISDPQLRARLARVGRERAASYQREAVLPRYEAMLEQLLTVRSSTD